MARQINDKRYDYVYFIGQYWNDDFMEMMKAIKTPIAVALHEVVDHFNPHYKKTPKLIDYCFKNKTDIVVFSENSRNDLLKYRNADNSHVHTIPFGLFETFPLCGNKVRMDLPEKYILFYGSIKPYKGLDLLYKAVSQIPIAEMKGVKVVVAGAGSDPYLEKIASDERFVLIHRYLLNDEIPCLIGHSMAVVCPYHSMSQSGIPQTVYAFAKPLIASDLPAFGDVVDDMQNGLLFEKEDAMDLADKILLVIDNPDILASLSDGVRNFPETHEKYNWNSIADKLVRQVFKFQASPIGFMRCPDPYVVVKDS
ncbi:MAG: glycosyltransferase family 4 protein [Bacteroidales bacterium]|nr:glycosyltransferase family 4 protein [Bacteroidales bacterium]